MGNEVIVRNISACSLKCKLSSNFTATSKRTHGMVLSNRTHGWINIPITSCQPSSFDDNDVPDMQIRNGEGNEPVIDSEGQYARLGVVW